MFLRKALLGVLAAGEVVVAISASSKAITSSATGVVNPYMPTALHGFPASSTAAAATGSSKGFSPFLNFTSASRGHPTTSLIHPRSLNGSSGGSITFTATAARGSSGPSSPSWNHPQVRRGRSIIGSVYPYAPTTLPRRAPTVTAATASDSIVFSPGYLPSSTTISPHSPTTLYRSLVTSSKTVGKESSTPSTFQGRAAHSKRGYAAASSVNPYSPTYQRGHSAIVTAVAANQTFGQSTSGLDTTSSIDTSAASTGIYPYSPTAGHSQNSSDVLGGHSSMYKPPTPRSPSHTPSPTVDVAPTAPTSCGRSTESGNFTLTWDDEPMYTPDRNSGPVYPPVFNPYHGLFFSNGYYYTPAPNDPYLAVTPRNMAVFLPNGSTQDIGSPSAAGARPGEIGAGPRAGDDAFWFNVYGASLGCDNSGPGECEFQIRKYAWDTGMGQEKLVAKQTATTEPCWNGRVCQLIRVEMTDGQFSRLSGVQIEANVHGQPRAFFMDNLDMGWYNNNCEATLARSYTRKA